MKRYEKQLINHPRLYEQWVFNSQHGHSELHKVLYIQSIITYQIRISLPGACHGMSAKGAIPCTIPTHVLLPRSSRPQSAFGSCSQFGHAPRRPGIVGYRGIILETGQFVLTDFREVMIVMIKNDPDISRYIS